MFKFSKETKLKLWLLFKPKTIKEVATDYPPWFKYRIKSTGQHCSLKSYSEDRTVSVLVNGHDSKNLNFAYFVKNQLVFKVPVTELEAISEV